MAGRQKGVLNKKTLERRADEARRPKRIGRCLGNGCDKIVKGWFCFKCKKVKDSAYELPIYHDPGELR